MYGLPGVDVADTLSPGPADTGRRCPPSTEERNVTRETNDTDRKPLEDSTLEGTEWADRPIDPDLHSDLGYDLVDWEVVPNACDDKKVFLPMEESMLRDEAFIVAEPGAYRDLGSML